MQGLHSRSGMDPAVQHRVLTTGPPGNSHIQLLYSSENGIFIYSYLTGVGFPGGSVVKNLSADAGDTGSIPGLGRSPGEENGNPF